MRLGFVGPNRGDIDALRAGAELLLFELGVARVVYLGNDDALDRAAKGWAEALGAPPDEAAFLTEAALLAPDGPAEVLEALLERDRRAGRLRDVAVLPPPPGRAVEMIEDRVVLMVFDKGVLDEDDVANATAIVFGQGNEPLLKPIGPRLFVSPGPLVQGGGHVAVLDVRPDSMACQICDAKGKVKQEHKLSLARGARMGVQ